jgi:hypothetical protein
MTGALGSGDGAGAGVTTGLLDTAVITGALGASGSVGASRKIQMSHATWLVMSAGMLIPSARSSPQ